MDYKKAFEILEIDISETEYKNITLDFLKKKYYKIALKKHPDKNGNTLESTEIFKDINNAYSFLENEINQINQINMNEKDKKDEKYKKDDSENFIYMNILKFFVMDIFSGKYNELILKIIKNIVDNCTEVTKKISLSLFDDLDKETSLKIYSFLSKYRSVFHLSQEIIDSVKEKIIEKCDDTIIYILNPSINDLFNNNFYKLYIDEQLFLVPLWHSELYFDDYKEKEIIVLCEPELPDNIYIDENNNIFISIEISIDEIHKSILNNTNKVIEISGIKYEIIIQELFMKKRQIYKIKNKGLTKIKNDIYDISEKDDIIFDIVIS